MLTASDVDWHVDGWSTPLVQIRVPSIFAVRLEVHPLICDPKFSLICDSKTFPTVTQALCD